MTEGLLVPGNSQVGFLKYKDRIYSFSSCSAALTWGKDPDSFIADVYKAARARLELVKILKLYEDLFEVKNDSLCVLFIGRVTSLFMCTELCVSL